jgi:putative long chain acyl-CoA synthase
LCPGAELSPQELTRALEVLPRAERPSIVQVVDAIPVTTWFRPLTGPLRQAGIPEPGAANPAWHLDATGRYRRLTEAAHQKLAGQAV